MNASSQDVNQTLEYRTTTAIARLLPTGLLLIFLGLLIFVLADPAPTGTIIGVVLCLVAGIALVGLALWRRVNHGKPLFTLSPDGIHYRIPWVKTFNIPWTEIRGVETDRRRDGVLVVLGHAPRIFDSSGLQGRDLSQCHRRAGVEAILRTRGCLLLHSSCEAPAGGRTSFRKARWSRWPCTTISCRSSRDCCAKPSKRGGSHFAINLAKPAFRASLRDRRMRRRLQSALRRAQRAGRSTLQWEKTRRRCRGGRS